MAKNKRKFIVLEGTDGSGKTEQFKKLTERMKKENIPFASFDFPQYHKPSSYFIKQYLNGNYGTWKEIGPYKASVFFALDRFGAGEEIKKALDKNNLVISNRFTASNMAHQGLKIKNVQERKKFFKWLSDFEFKILNIPCPSLNIILHVPARKAHALIEKKGKREYLKHTKRDIHEQDLTHLEKAEKVYLEIARLFPKEFKIIECVKGGKLLTIKKIHQKIWQIIKKIL